MANLLVVASFRAEVIYMHASRQAGDGVGFGSFQCQRKRKRAPSTTTTISFSIFSIGCEAYGTMYTAATKWQALWKSKHLLHFCAHGLERNLTWCEIIRIGIIHHLLLRGLFAFVSWCSSRSVINLHHSKLGPETNSTFWNRI